MQETEKKAVPVMIYTEATPNPESLKFVVNRPLFPNDYYEFQEVAEAQEVPMVSELFDIGGVKTVFLSNNFVTVTKESATLWVELMPRIKETLRDFLESGREVFTQGFSRTSRQGSEEVSAGADGVEVKIRAALEKYVKPAVEMDGGAISFVSFEDGKLTLRLQGACSGCPSSTVTLKQGIENLMQRMVPEVREVVAESEL